MHRIHDGDIYVPHVFEDGTYGAADPALGRTRHHIANRVRAQGMDELRALLARGWPIWMSRQGTRDRRLVSNGIVDAPADAAPAVRLPAAAPVRPRREEPAARVPEPHAHVDFGKLEVPEQDVARHLDVLAGMTDAEVAAEAARPRRFVVGSAEAGRRTLQTAWAPFDHVNDAARIVIVGITPGRQQMLAALEEAVRALRSGSSHAEALAAAKVHASFAGQMRGNIVKMLDAIGVNAWLGIDTTESLWGTDAGLAHFTSAIRYPTFIDGENYSRSPDLNATPFLFGAARRWLAPELARFPAALVVPMGDMVAETVTRVGRAHGLGPERILDGLPHASPANNGPVGRFLAGDPGDAWGRRRPQAAAKVAALEPAAAIIEP